MEKPENNKLRTGKRNTENALKQIRALKPRQKRNDEYVAQNWVWLLQCKLDRILSRLINI